LPSAYGDTRQRLVQWTPQPVPVPRALMALGKEGFFAECLVAWHSAKNPPVGPFASIFAECLGKSTRQRYLCRFPGFLLCRVPLSALGKAFFAECPTKGTRQRSQHSAKSRIPVVLEPLNHKYKDTVYSIYRESCRRVCLLIFCTYISRDSSRYPY
jgi:hypothetical protein